MGAGGWRAKDRSARNPSRLAGLARRASVLHERNFRRFYAGYVTSLLGTSMSAVAVTFAVLGNGGSATDVGYVIAAWILPQVVLVLASPVLVLASPVLVLGVGAAWAVLSTLVVLAPPSVRAVRWLDIGAVNVPKDTL